MRVEKRSNLTEYFFSTFLSGTVDNCKMLFMCLPLLPHCSINSTEKQLAIIKHILFQYLLPHFHTIVKVEATFSYLAALITTNLIGFDFIDFFWLLIWMLCLTPKMFLVKICLFHNYIVYVCVCVCVCVRVWVCLCVCVCVRALWEQKKRNSKRQKA